MDIQPIDRAIPATDGRWNMGHSNRRASGHHSAVPCPSTFSKLNQPAMPGIPAADMAGSLMALSGILMALLRQRQTGRGDYLDISMHDSLLAWTPNVMGPIFAENRAAIPKHERTWGGAAFYNIYATREGAHIVLGGVEHKFAENFLNKAGRPDLIPLCHQPPGPVQDPVKSFIREFFGARTLGESLEWLSTIDVCYAPVRTLKEGVFDPNTAARGMLLRDDQGLEHLGVPIKFSHEPAQPVLRAPELGEGVARRAPSCDPTSANDLAERLRRR